MSEWNLARDLIATAILVSAPLSASSAQPNEGFAGRWRADTTSLSKVKPTVLLLTGGTFQEDKDHPIAADGLFHAVTDQGGYIDETSILVVSDRLVKQVDKAHGRIVYTVDYALSADGRQLTSHVTSFTNPTGQPSESETVERRVGQPVAGVHPISGTWRRLRLSVDATSDWIITAEGDRFSRKTALGSGYDAILGSGPVAVDGDASGARVLVSSPRQDTVVESWMSAQGVSGAVLRIQLMPGGTTIRALAFAPGEKKPTTFYLQKVTFRTQQ